MISPFFKCLLLLLIFFSLSTYGQKTFTISGFVQSGSNAAPIDGATIKILPLNATITTDSLGFYTVDLKSGTYTFQVSGVGIISLQKQIKVSANHTFSFVLQENANNLDEVVVSSSRNQRSLVSTQMGAEKLSMKAVKNIPMIFGERDILKAIQLLPGIKSAGEGGSGIYVRGGSSDQNLILMDDVPVYNASHLFGFFSTFNADAVDDITVYKTGMPAQYGGRLSSVLDIRMNQGDDTNFSANGGIGLISSKLTLQGPIKKERSSFLISARRTYVDALLRLSPDSAINQNTMYFYDVNARLDFQLDAKNKLIFTGYLGSDKLGLSDIFGITWGNTLASAQWKHIISTKLTSATTVSFTRYNNTVAVSTSTNNLKIYSQISDLALKHDYYLVINNKNTLKFGANAIYHQVTPGEITTDGPSSYNPTNYQKRFSLENAIYATHDWKASDKLNVAVGLRLSGFSILGKGDFLTVDPTGKVTNVSSYESGEIVKTYLNLEPRLSLSYRLNEWSSIKTSYVRNAQNMHMISNATASRPTDKWLASTLMVKPEISDQFALGYYRNLFADQFELNVEAYYKTMQNQLDYRDGADVFNADAIETQLLYGKGRAYGLELLFKKRAGDFTGWISYTLAKTERQIEGINSGKWYNAKQDRTHDIAIIGSYELNKKWSLSASWVYYTGDAVTFPSGKYSVDGQSFFYYGDRNSYRMPAYHRLDLGANLQLAKRKTFTSELSFSIYNAYGRKNAYSITFQEAENDPSKTEVVRTTLFKVLPSISYNFKFL